MFGCLGYLRQSLVRTDAESMHEAGQSDKLISMSQESFGDHC